jgi:hypothetical protein
MPPPTLPAHCMNADIIWSRASGLDGISIAPW